MAEVRAWHQLFTLVWVDRLHGTGVAVEDEKDLSHHKQLLDLVLMRGDDASIEGSLPDGFETLLAHNLITFKSLHEAFDGWALGELIGHYVNYRKQVRDARDEMLTEDQFQLFAVCVRSPKNLMGQATLTPVRPGVYDLDGGVKRVRVVVIHELPQEPNNAMLLAFSASVEQREYARKHLQQRSQETSSLILQLFEVYKKEGIAMPVDLKELNRQIINRTLREATAEEILEAINPEKLLSILPLEKRLEGVPPQKRLEGLSAEERLEGLPARKRLEGLSAEELLEGVPARKRLEGLSAEERLEGVPPQKRLEGLSAEERLEGLSAEERAKLMRLLLEDKPSSSK